MSRSPTKEAPQISAFEAMAGLCDLLESMPEFADDRVASHVWRLRVAIRSERTRTLDRLPNIAWAQEGIELVKTGKPATPPHIRAIVEAAEWAIAEQRNADDRAVDRLNAMQAGLSLVRAGDLLKRCEAELREAARAYATEPNPDGDGYQSCSSIADEIAEFVNGKPVFRDPGESGKAHNPNGLLRTRSKEDLQ